MPHAILAIPAGSPYGAAPMPSQGDASLQALDVTRLLLDHCVMPYTINTSDWLLNLSDMRCCKDAYTTQEGHSPCIFARATLKTICDQGPLTLLLEDIKDHIVDSIGNIHGQKLGMIFRCQLCNFLSHTVFVTSSELQE